MDSTTKLFSRLDLTENFTSPRHKTLNKDMDDMNIDLVEEVSAPSFNPRTGSRRKKHNYHWRDSDPRNFRTSSTTRDDTEQHCTRERSVQQMNNALESGDSSQVQDEVLESEQDNVSSETIKSRRSFEKSPKLPVPFHPQNKGSPRKKGNAQLPVIDGGDLVLKSREKKGKREGDISSCDQFQHDVYWRNHGPKRMVHNGYIAPCNSAKSRIPTEVDGLGVIDLVDRETCSSYTNISNTDRMKGVDSPGVSQPKTKLRCNSAKSRILTEVDGMDVIDLVDLETCSSYTDISNKDMMKVVDSPGVSQPKTKQGHRRWSQFASLPKNTGPRRLVQEGPTSHYNVAHGKYAAKDYEVGTMMHDELLDGNSSHHIVSHDSEGRHPYKKKGKMIVEDKFLSGGHDKHSSDSNDNDKGHHGDGKVEGDDNDYSKEDDDNNVEDDATFSVMRATMMTSTMTSNTIVRSTTTKLDDYEESTAEGLCSVVAEEVPTTADDVKAFRSSEDIAWRKYDITLEAPVLPYEESVCASKREEGSSCHLSDLRHTNTTEYGDYVNHVDDSTEITNSHRLNPSVVLAPPESEIRSRGNQGRQKFMKGRRECNSICSNYGGSSCSTFENSEASYPSSRHIPHTRLTRTHDSQHHGDIFDPVIELNELPSPEVRWNNPLGQSTRASDRTSTRVSQVESDEILARQLQEQFYDEVAGSAGSEEIDATIAWSLQQEDARLSASTARSGQSDHREASMAHLYAYYAQLPYRNCSGRRSDRAQSRTPNSRRNYYSSEIDLETRMLAEVRNFTGMDLGMRRNFLEALEAAFDQSNDVLAENAMENDFNEYDYEMLLALDENNHQQTGASESQINSLPQSVIQSDDVEEACTVCLENPSLGDIIRHLPCLHKFHKECIDTWLRRKTWCPVCKSEIT